MDLNLIKQRLESLNKQSNNTGGERKNNLLEAISRKTSR